MLEQGGGALVKIVLAAGAPHACLEATASTRCAKMQAAEEQPGPRRNSPPQAWRSHWSRPSVAFNHRQLMRVPPAPAV